jgi:hypothetical protein
MATEWDGYFYIEDLGMTADQRQTLVDTLKAWGLRNTSPKPKERNHWRVRGDALALIFEAVFDADNLTAAWVQAKLAQIFGVPVGNITYTTTSTAYGPLITFKYNSVNKLRLGIFAGLAATWEQSRAAAFQLVHDNISAWSVP